MKNSKSKLTLHVIVFLGMMGALSIVLDFVGSIKLAPYIRIGIADLPNRLNDFLFGPFIGGFYGGAMDIIKFMINPDGAFFPGYTLTAITASIIFGGITHGFKGHKISIVRIIIAEVLIKLICNLGMNTAWSVMLYKPDLAALPFGELITSDAFRALISARALTNLIQLPTDTIVIFVVLKALEKAKVLGMIRNWTTHAGK